MYWLFYSSLLQSFYISFPFDSCSLSGVQTRWEFIFIGLWNFEMDRIESGPKSKVDQNWVITKWEHKWSQFLSDIALLVQITCKMSMLDQHFWFKHYKHFSGPNSRPRIFPAKFLLKWLMSHWSDKFLFQICRKLVQPGFIDNNEVLDFLSRQPSNPQLLQLNNKSERSKDEWRIFPPCWKILEIAKIVIKIFIS